MTPAEIDPRVHAVLLAAGASRRMAPFNKLLTRGADGRSLIAVTLAQLRASRLRHITVVVGYQANAVIDALAAGPDHGAPVRIVTCADYREGLSHSLAAGLRALDHRAHAVMVCLGDMPLVTPSVIDGLIAAWQPGGIVVPLHQGQRGNPVVWDRAYVPRMLETQGDQGAAWLLAEQAGCVRAVAVEHAWVLRDADTQGALRALPGGPWRGPDGTLI